MKNSKFFPLNKKNTIKLEKKKFLLDILNPTSKNTKYFESPPPNIITNNQIGRIYLQIHQIINLVNNLGYTFKNKTFLDIGCGNGMIPRLISAITKVKYSYGIDPFLDGEHQTSWQKHDHFKIFSKITNRFKKKKFLEFKDYSKFLKYENFSLIPERQKIVYKKKYHYEFHQLSADNLTKLKKKIDIAYLKSIEHFNDWDKLFKNLKKNLNKKGIIIFKHRSFFSYLGAHRYANIEIPWGHVLLSENQYKKFIKRFHKEREYQIIDFYYKGLNYPRTTVGELLKYATKYSFRLKLITIEPPHYNRKTTKFIKKINNFWKITEKNHPRVTAEEILSGMYHIVLEKL